MLRRKREEDRSCWIQSFPNERCAKEVVPWKGSGQKDLQVDQGNAADTDNPG
jgi:hypothetical protein